SLAASDHNRATRSGVVPSALPKYCVRSTNSDQAGTNKWRVANSDSDRIQHERPGTTDGTRNSADRLRRCVFEFFTCECAVICLRHGGTTHDDRRMATLVTFNVVDHGLGFPKRC